MLTLNDGRTELWQWDTGRKLSVDADCSQVHFSNKIFGRSIDVDVVDGVAIIPDILLQTDKDLMAWAFVGGAENGYTKIGKAFKVNKRNKPADYVFAPTDQTTLGEILERLEEVENKPFVTKENIEKALGYTPVGLPSDDKGNLMFGKPGQYAMSDGNGGIVWEEFTDEELLTQGYTLQERDLIRNASWVPTNTNTPSLVTGRTATRKFKTSKVPIISKGKTNIYNVLFWKNGGYVGATLFIELEKNWESSFVFDEIAFNISYNASLPAEQMGIQLKYKEDRNFEKVLVLGDSISADYYGNYTKWVTMLQAEGFFPEDTTNDSIHATGFVARYNNQANDFLTRIEAITNKDTYDLVVVFGGINDFMADIPMGDGEADKSTYFKPAVDYFFDYLVNNFTQARIVVLSPLRTHHQYANLVGCKQDEYTAYIREVAKSYCLPVLNLSEESGFIPFNRKFKDMWTYTGYVGGDGKTGDGVHPSAEYIKKFLAPMIKGFLQSIKPD